MGQAGADTEQDSILLKPVYNGIEAEFSILKNAGGKIDGIQ